LALLRRFHQEGIPVLPGTDFTVEFLFPGSSLHEELVEMVERVGLTPHEALQAATRQSAEAVGLGDELGTVQAGKLAELVLLDADPLTDITNVQRIHAVVHEGRLLDRHALDEELDRAAAKIRSAPAQKNR
jgi:imidazolonepropionase-like amidohydrolase